MPKSVADLPELKAGAKRIKRNPDNGHIYEWNARKGTWDYTRENADSDEEAI